MAAQWGNVQNSSYTVTMHIVGQDYPGFLRDVTTLIANDRLNIAGVRSRVERQKLISIIDVDILVPDIAVFERIRVKIAALPKVTAVERM
ncbi:MAG TPA: hypothetical protein DCL74_05105 [Succinivibrionaceae bacterium]|nr:hypothetical protein [Succinivibrionaceae bacterium]